MDGPAGLRQALLKHPDVLLRSFTENLMTYALGRRVEYTDMPAVRAIVRDAGEEQQPHVVVRPRRRQQRRVPDGEGRTAAPKKLASRRRRATVEETRMFITKKHISRRTVLKGMGATMALPLLEAMVPARTRSAQAAAARKCGSPASRWCTARPAARRSASQKNLWSPAARARDFDLTRAR